MSRKRKRASEDYGDDDADKFSNLESIVLVHSANRQTRTRKFDMSVALLRSKQFVDPKAFGKIKWEAKGILRKWNATPGAMPLGAARFILEQCRKDEESAKIASHLELNNLATTVISMHTNLCRGTCTEDIHRQHQHQFVAQGAEDVYYCDPLVFSSAEEINHRHDDGTIINSNIGCTADVPPAVPESIDIDGAHDDDESSYINDGYDVDDDEAYDEGIVQKLAKTGAFTETQVLALSGRPLGNKRRKISMRRLAAHWAVRWNQTNQAMSNFCYLFKVHHDDVFQDLPWTGRTLVAAKNKKSYTFRPIHGPSPKGKILVGEYVHFGIADGILGTSIGTVHWHEHVTQFRRIHLICPELLPQVFIEAMKPRNGDEFEKDIAATWTFENVGFDREPVHVTIHVNIDGVQWFKNSKTKGTPILGRIHSISNSKHCIKIPNGKPFIIGVFMQSGKCNVQDFVSDFIQELRELVESTEDRPFSVKLKCMICDAPQRSELKGISYSISSPTYIIYIILFDFFLEFVYIQFFATLLMI